MSMSASPTDDILDPSFAAAAAAAAAAPAPSGKKRVRLSIERESMATPKPASDTKPSAPRHLDKESRVSYTIALPATGLDVLLVGRSDLCRPLAESMLRVTFDRSLSNDASSGRRRNGGRDGSKKRKRQSTSVGANANDVHSGGGSRSISATSSRKDSAVEALRRHLKGKIPLTARTIQAVQMLLDHLASRMPFGHDMYGW